MRSSTDIRYFFLVSTGMRISEALGLCWKDVDWKRNRVRIERGLVWSGQTWSIQRPKTKAGARWVTLTGSAIAALNQLQMPESVEAPIFRTHTGEPP
jgi:integrase